MTVSNFKRIIWIGGLVLVLLGVGGYAYLKYRGLPPRELLLDVNAGVAVRKVKDPDQRFAQYLSLRYGSLDDPANRQKAFLDFFNPEHIRALQFLVANSPKNQRLANIAASANWVAQYRESLTAAERAALNTRLNNEAGKHMLRQATSQYNAQDVYYRGQTAQVISQLLKTIHEVQVTKP